MQSLETFLCNRQPVHEYEIRLSNAEYSQFINIAFDSVGKKYGTREMFGVGIKKVLRLKRNPFENKEETYCSEYQNDVLKLVGIDLGLRSPAPKCVFDSLANEAAKNKNIKGIKTWLTQVHK